MFPEVSFASLPRDVVCLIKRFAQEPHPTATMIKSLLYVDTECEKIIIAQDPVVTFLSVDFLRRQFRYDHETMRFKHERNCPYTHRRRVLIVPIHDASALTPPLSRSP